MNAYTVRVEAERLIGEDRVPTDVLVELIEQYGDATVREKYPCAEGYCRSQPACPIGTCREST